MKRPVDPIEDVLWRYARDAISQDDFEAFVFADEGVHARLGDEDYFALASANYRDTSTAARYERGVLAREIAERHFHRECQCQSWADRTRLGWGAVDPLAKGYDTLGRLTPWISVRCCTDCGTSWLVGDDTIDDVYIVQRLTAAERDAILTADRWPDAFRNEPNLVPDDSWLRAFGHASLEAWRVAEDPLRRRGLTPPD